MSINLPPPTLSYPSLDVLLRLILAPVKHALYWMHTLTSQAKRLVLAPLSILEAAWAEDIYKFQPDIKFGVAYAKNRKKIFEDGAFEMVITNFEAVNFLC
jgi:hypothetical protein